MKTAFNRLAALALVTGFALIASQSQAGPSIKNLTETNLADSSNSPFHLNTDRYKEAFQTISSYLSSHEELPSGSILLADNHGHFLAGVISNWTYYTYGTHKGIELYVFNPEDGNQFLTVEVWLPKEQQRNMDKRDSYLTSFAQIESLLASSLKYRLDLVFQDNVPIEWGKGYGFKLDDEGISLSYTVTNANHPRKRSSMSSTDTSSTEAASTDMTQATPSETPMPTMKKHRKHAKVSAVDTMVPTPTVTAESN